jgi:hypothetical protein
MQGRRLSNWKEKRPMSKPFKWIQPHYNIRNLAQTYVFKERLGQAIHFHYTLQAMPKLCVYSCQFTLLSI